MTIKYNAKRFVSAIMEKLMPTSTLWGRYQSDALSLAQHFDFRSEDLEASHERMDENRGYLNIKRLLWFIPDFENAYWGGIRTILMFAAHFRKTKNIRNCFVIVGNTTESKITKAIVEAFPILQGEEVHILTSENKMPLLGEADASICTLWTTAYPMLRFNQTKRKFYFIQDFEPLFYPAGSTQAQTEATYRFGFYGICNTITLKQVYEQQYGGRGEFFTPSVDTSVFYPSQEHAGRKPLTLFFYARPEHPRNGFELGITALKKLKSRMGDKVRIITAGASWDEHKFGTEGVVENLGLLSYGETGDLYRQSDAGLAMMFTRHPSYIPFELMASGCLVISNFNPATVWLLRDGENCLLAHPSASSLCDVIEHALNNSEERARIIANALTIIREHHSNWEQEMEKIYKFMCNPKA